MKTHTRMALSALVVAVTAGAAVAHGDGEENGQGHHRWHGGQDMMQTMMRGHGMMDAYGGAPGMGMMVGDMPMMGRVPMVGGMPMMEGMYGGLGKMLDEDGDGTVTPEEVHTGLERLRNEYDADGNGTLSIDEFETLHSALIREMMVDRFQYLDSDGDGQITEEEMHAPAKRMDRMQSWRDRMMDGDGYRPGQMTPDTDGVRPGQGHMMDNGGPGMQNRQGN